MASTRATAVDGDQIKKPQHKNGKTNGFNIAKNGHSTTSNGLAVSNKFLTVIFILLAGIKCPYSLLSRRKMYGFIIAAATFGRGCIAL